jgi:hypothetical protein
MKLTRLVLSLARLIWGCVGEPGAPVGNQWVEKYHLELYELLMP